MTAPTLPAAPPLRRLTLWLAAALVALTAALTPAAPARAQDTDDIVRFLLGVAAIAVIVRAIDDNHTPSYIAPTVLPGSCLEVVRVRGRLIEAYNARCLRRAGYRGLPDHCLATYQTNRGERRGYVSNCLYRAGYSAHGGGFDRDPPRSRLPSRCEINYRVGGDRSLGYDALCLRNAGFHSLPRRCERYTRGGDTIYDGQCLWDAGYRRSR